MDQFEEERVGVHKAVNLHARRLITAFYAILEAAQVGRAHAQVDTSPDSILRTQVDNFQMKLHNDSFLHSCRSLYTVASDLTMNRLLHPPGGAEQAPETEKIAMAEELYKMREKVRENDAHIEGHQGP